jgi:2-polyprenyl-3-methyl-5-hydroxy-6-metoxy-1,4-benzoquinol methylase
MADAQLASTPALDRLDATFRSESPVFRETVTRARDTLGESWAVAFDQALDRLLPDDGTTSAAVAGYSRFALELLRLQARFDKEQAYARKSYADVSAEVYANEAYMTSCYLPGLLLSDYLWPHHYRQLRYFEDFFVAEMASSGAEAFYDVGVGTGLYSRIALVGAVRTRGHGIDISPSSKSFAEGHVAAFGVGQRYGVELRDVVKQPAPPLDWLICVEVLEHLEDPVEFLRALRAMLSLGGKAFIGTALNAPNADHIYLYRTTNEVRVQLQEAGFFVEHAFSATAGPPRDGSASVPEVAAFVVT